ncbi:MAG: hypothetical protein IJT91_05650 [Clostridia bacterium]|nr:hypothetical protein [Clostridia bacterium]
MKNNKIVRYENGGAQGVPAVTAGYIALKVVIVLLAIAIVVLSVVFICEMIGGVVGDGCAQVVSTLEQALNGDFDSYWSLLPEDYVNNQAVKNASYAMKYKADMKSAYKKYSDSLDKFRTRYSLEASKQRKITPEELEQINRKLISDEHITDRCTEAFSITLTVSKTVGSDTTLTDRDGFIIGKIDGEWYPLDFEFIEPDLS